jgi:hypothetical protein
MAELFQNCSEIERNMYLSAYNTITQMEMWEFIKHYEPPENSGFMFDSNPTIFRIMSKISENYNNNHSGGSMACTMRKMQIIAKEKT